MEEHPYTSFLMEGEDLVTFLLDLRARVLLNSHL